MDSILLEKRLSGPLHRSDIDFLCHQVNGNGALREDLYRALFSADKRTGDNAAWVMTHLSEIHDGWLQERQEALIDEAMKTTSATRRRLLMTLLLRTTFKKETLRGDFVDFCFSLIPRADEPVGIRSVSMRLSLVLCRHYPELMAELREIVSMLPQSELSPALRSVAKKIMR
ncbi:MAG: hypothetical protein IJR71_01105 [Prevotella sp.]|nr:hypothetical protein [Prevotella sp.]